MSEPDTSRETPATAATRRPAGRFPWKSFLRVPATVLALWLVFRFVDADAVLSRLAALRPGWLVLGLAVSVLQVAVLGWRWRYTSARLGIELPLRVAMEEYYLGILLNQLLPGGVAGDVSRAWRHARTEATAGPAVRAVILERASAQAVMTLTAAISLLAVAWIPMSIRASVAAAVAAAVAVLVVAATRRPTKESALGRLLDDARRAMLTRETIGPQVGTALVVVASYLAVYLIAARAIGAPTSLLTMLPLVAPVLMTMLIPVTVAGWGIREAAAVALWSGAGMTPEDGAAISVAYGLLVLISSAPGLVVLSRTLLGDPGRRGRPPRE